MSAPLAPASLSVFQGTDVPKGSQSRCSPWRMCFTLPSTLFPASNDLFWQPRPVKHPLPWPSPPFPSRWSHWLFSHLWCLSLRLWCCPGCVLCLDKNKNQDEKLPQSFFLPLAPESVFERGGRVGRTVGHRETAVGCWRRKNCAVDVDDLQATILGKR